MAVLSSQRPKYCLIYLLLPENMILVILNLDIQEVFNLYYLVLSFSKQLPKVLSIEGRLSDRLILEFYSQVVLSEPDARIKWNT